MDKDTLLFPSEGAQLVMAMALFSSPENSIFVRSCLYDSLTLKFCMLFKFNDISLLADLMGHDSIETTRIYLTRSSVEQKELLDRIITW